MMALTKRSIGISENTIVQSAVVNRGSNSYLIIDDKVTKLYSVQTNILNINKVTASKKPFDKFLVGNTVIKENPNGGYTIFSTKVDDLLKTETKIKNHVEKSPLIDGDFDNGQTEENDVYQSNFSIWMTV